MNKLQAFGYATLASLFTASQTFAAIETGQASVNSGLKGSGNDVVVALTNIANGILGLLALIATGYGLYGGFLIVTAGGDEEKVKKGRTIVIQILIGLLVIFLANSLVSWAISFLATK